MATNMISGILDADQENIKSQLEYAKALRAKGLDTQGQMVSGHYVAKNPWQNFIEAATGAGVERYQRDKQRGIETEMENQRNAFLTSMPTSGDTRQVFDPAEQDFGPTQATVEQFVPKPTRQYAQEMREWATRAPKGMEGIQGFALQQAMTAPEKQAELEQKAKDTQAQLLIKAQEERLRRQEADDLKRMMFGVTSDQRQQGLNIQKQAAIDKQEREAEKRGDKIVAGAEKEIGQTQPKIGQLDNIIANIDKLQDPSTGQLSSAAKNVIGPLDSRFPEFMRFKSTNDAANAIEGLKNQMSLMSLSEARAAAGQSFGAITQKEWPIFQNYVATLATSGSEDEFNKKLTFIREYIGKNKEALGKIVEAAEAKKAGAYDGGGAGVRSPQQPPQQPPAAGGVSPKATVVSRVKLKDGSTGVLWSDGSRTRE